MTKTIFKSIGAILAGFVLVVILSILIDLILINTGLMKQPFDLNPSWFIILVIFYRSLLGTIGAYLTAKLSPNRPLFHSILGGIFGFIIAIIGAIAMWDKPPHWYPIALILTTLPSAWLGGQLYVNRNQIK